MIMGDKRVTKTLAGAGCNAATRWMALLKASFFVLLNINFAPPGLPMRIS